MRERCRVLALGLALLAGCSVGPEYRQPEPVAPTAWRSTVAPSTAALAAVPQVEQPDRLDHWWTWFEDPTLNALVEQALAEAFDVRAAQARLRAARAERRAVQAGLFPQLGTSASSNRVQNPLPALAPDLTFTLHEVGFDAGWEFDLFGRQRRRVEAASAVVAAKEIEIRAVRTVLGAEVARVYWEYRSAGRQMELMRRAIELNSDDARRARALADAGLIARDAVLIAAGAGDARRAQLAALEFARSAAQRQLERLLAVVPGQLDQVLAGGARPLPRIAPRLLLTPAAVLRQRPDIQRAERQLAAATALEGAAIADLYPRLSLGLFFGLRNTALSALLTLASKSWSGGASVTQPLFDAGRLRAVVDQRNAEAEAALVEYERAALDALHETETALSRWLAAEQEREALAAALVEREAAAGLTRRRQAQGVGGARETIAAELATLAARAEVERGEAAVTIATVAVLKSLGAGIPLDLAPTAEDARPGGSSRVAAAQRDAGLRANSDVSSSCGRVASPTSPPRSAPVRSAGRRTIDGASPTRTCGTGPAGHPRSPQLLARSKSTRPGRIGKGARAIRQEPGSARTHIKERASTDTLR